MPDRGQQGTEPGGGGEPGAVARPTGLHHVGYWVEDLDAAMAHATALLGVGPFQVLEHVELGDFRHQGKPAVLDHTAAFAAWGPVLLELNVAHRVEPPELRQALRIAPGAVSHVAWTTDDLSAENERMAAAGCSLLTTSVGGAVCNWFSGGPLFAHPIEVHEPPPGVQAFWQSVRDAAG
jgi:catechol 2,3-dioxygenase-like lactoylglutathione lyase family enzyme